VIPLIRRDLRLAVRAGGGFGLGLVFFLIVIVLVPFGVGPEAAVLSRIAPGMLWVAALLAALLSLDRIFALDFEDGSLALIATSPLPLEGVALAKTTAHFITTGLPLTIAAPALGFLLNLAPSAYGFLLLSLIFGAEAVRRGAEGLSASTPLLMLAGITAGTVALLPFATAAALRINLR